MKELPKVLNMCEQIYMCNMGNMTLSVPEDMHKEMKKFSEVKWSEVARKAFTEKLEALRLAEKLAKKAS